MTAPLRIEPRQGDAVVPLLGALAGLRIDVFRAFPYLYDGTLDYEERYLRKLLDAPNHVVICAFDGEKLVGAATGAPLAHEHDEFKAPFRARGIDVAPIFYCSESVLLPDYRGRGVGHAFFDGRERHAASLGLNRTAFCAVVRPVDHPARPRDYQPLDPFWTKRGYTELDGITTSFSWRDVGEDEMSAKPMQFWGRGF